MAQSCQRALTRKVLNKAKEYGASLAGIATVSSVRKVSSCMQNTRVKWPDSGGSLLVMALYHDPCLPYLDWWIGRYGTSGNQKLMEIGYNLGHWIRTTLNGTARDLPYHVEKGGIYLKEAAVVAGLGVIGKNNLLITPEFGPRVRLRAMHLDMDLQPCGALEFKCCDNCNMPCTQACPQGAFQEGSYSRSRCNLQMNMDAAGKSFGQTKDRSFVCIKYCRACELACPIGNEPSFGAGRPAGEVPF
ncbi:MAG: epoxyqueuosine reductase [Deltaproteobacteria bacterium]|nr:epoxyqueuosine reductase [Deltaproteobacteria bacterium]MBW2153200.1 epoxyqueuosine reductase [Deltaproteobacteria bacterium]